MKKQRVLIVHNFYQIPGGEDSVMENEKRLLLENGHEVIVYTRHNKEIKNKKFFNKVFLFFESVFSFKTYSDIKKLILENDIDLVHVHNTVPLISPSVYYAAKSLKKTTIQTVHNFRLLCPAGTFTRVNKICEECVNKNLLSAIKYRCYRQSFFQSMVLSINLSIHRLIGTYNKIDGFICLTEFNKKKLTSLINENKIFIKPNFVKEDNKNMKKEGEYFMFLGRIEEIKGIKLLVEAWRDIKDIELLIVGTGPLENQIKNYIDENKMKNVKLVGFKEKKEVVELIKHSKALIIPSQCYEGFPMTIVEAFSLGVPVIAGDIGNLSSIIEDGNNGLLFSYNSKYDLKEKVYYLENNKEVLMKLSEGATNSFESKYNSKLNYKILSEIYDECIRRNS